MTTPTTPDTTAVPLSWCAQCRKLTALHPLVHTLEEHAPLLGNILGRPYRDRSWRTATLRDERRCA